MRRDHDHGSLFFCPATVGIAGLGGLKRDRWWPFGPSLDDVQRGRPLGTYIFE